MAAPKAVVTWVAQLYGLYQQGQAPSEETYALYIDALADVPDDLLMAACRSLIRSEEFMPKPATIRKYADQVRRDQQQAARLALPAPEPPPALRAQTISWDDVAYDDLRGGVHVPDGIERIAGLVMPPHVAEERAAAYERARLRIAQEAPDAG